MQTHCKQTTDYQDKVIKMLEEAPDVNYKHWSEFEVDTLKKYYGTKKMSAIALAFGRTINAVNRKASLLGLHYKKKGEV